jgi:arginyl-tRNA synthetase
MIEQIKIQLKELLEKAFLTSFNTSVNVVIEAPKRKEQGDLSIPVFTLAKAINLPLPATSNFIMTAIQSSAHSSLFSELVMMGGFFNIRLNSNEIVKVVLNDFINKKNHYGDSFVGNNKVVCIDYSSPNIAKPFSIGHLRSTIIGHAIGNILEKCGYKVVRINHLGDFGTQFGKIIYAYQHFGDEKVIQKDPINELVKLYVEFHELAKSNPSMDDEARRIFKELEQGNPEYTKLWQWFRKVSLEDYMEVYKLLNVNFDSYDGEAFYNDKMEPVINELSQKGLLKADEGAMIVDLGESMPPALIQKSDGSTLYITRDLAALFYRKNTYHFDKCLYVVGNEQKLHFEQIKAVIRKMDYHFDNQIEHINFGLVLQDGKKMSTRKGKIVKLIDVLNEAIKLSLAYIVEKNPDLDSKELIAKKIGVSAVIFNDLKNYRANDFEFNLEDMVKFEGQTGPYLQYTSVRIGSILNTEPFAFDGNVDESILSNELEFEMIKLISQYQMTLEKSAEESSPSILAKYLLNLASLFNSYYGKEKINVENLLEKNTKKHLLTMVKTILDNGMSLLGMQIIEKM